MRNIQILSTLILCMLGLMFMTNIAYSQADFQPNSLEVIVDESSNAYFTVNFEKGATLYSLCKKYHVATIDAMMLNEIVNPEQISIGQKLILPLNKEYFKVSNKYAEGYIPVYYKTKKSETLFRISKVYFSQDVKDMIQRNELSGFTLAIDQKLLVGYYILDGKFAPTKQEEKVLVQREVQKKTDVVSTDQAVKVKDITTKKIEESKVEEIVQVEKTQVEKAHFEEIKTRQIEPEVIGPEITKTTTEATQPTTPEQVITEVDTPEQINPVPSVAKYRFRPNKKARFNKVIKSDRLDHSVAEKVNQPQEGQLDGTTNADSTAVEVVKEPESNLVSKSIKGIGYWDKKGKDYENLMVLHKTAEVNTLIKLTNPVNGMSTFARVVGRIPDNAFKKDIDVVMSPAVAKKIGAIDTRVQIAMTYQINKP